MFSSSRPARSLLALGLLLACSWLTACADKGTPGPQALPGLLSATGLFLPDRAQSLAPGVIPFEPAHALWTDGAAKRRWIQLPSGTRVDTSDPDCWQFPVGTRLWKEFSLGERVETRLIVRELDGSWSYATYLWRPDGREADLVEASGQRAVRDVAPGVPYDLPSRQDCRTCHESGLGPVLGFSRAQLDVDQMQHLTALGLLSQLPETAQAPSTPAAAGYLHGNCAHCHNSRGPLRALGLDFQLPAAGTLDDVLPAQRSAVGVAAQRNGSLRIAPGHPEASDVIARMRSRAPAAQMPPLGTRLPHVQGLALVESWIRQDLASPPPVPPPTSESSP